MFLFNIAVTGISHFIIIRVEIQRFENVSQFFLFFNVNFFFLFFIARCKTTTCSSFSFYKEVTMCLSSICTKSTLRSIIFRTFQESYHVLICVPFHSLSCSNVSPSDHSLILCSNFCLFLLHLLIVIITTPMMLVTFFLEISIHVAAYFSFK